MRTTSWNGEDGDDNNATDQLRSTKYKTRQVNTAIAEQWGNSQNAQQCTIGVLFADYSNISEHYDSDIFKIDKLFKYNRIQIFLFEYTGSSDFVSDILETARIFSFILEPIF